MASDEAAKGAADPAPTPTHAPNPTPKLWGSALAYQLVRLALGISLAIGLGIMLYPLAQRLQFAYRSVQVANEYDRAVSALASDVLEQEWRMAQEYNRARAYNRAHDVNTIVDPFSGDPRTERLNDEYWSLVNPLNNGMMGYMDIPRIGQRLSIYHGTDEDALLKGVGHIQGTSLPVGGEGTHCVVSGHRGLPGAKIFTDLDQMREGDLVLLHVLGHHLAYEVDQIQEVLPEEIAALDIVEGEDLVTLVTCTPYAVNTHRLLVRGHRVPYVEAPMPTAEVLSWLTPLRLGIICCLSLLVTVLRRRRRRRKSGPVDEVTAGHG